ncbi:EscU/YscU/HrcU family type III secretion system export apparatus switch protein [Undibacterium sp. Di27W]|uniref:EscU/YscU/HrcU family type III secretion system export apparatus switch protein n=1 Tax=Undibacterium sp. Di27W TaxID=3413036 RepID=UPI003BF286AB
MSAPDPPVKPVQNAVALAYQTGDAAPKVVAKGKGLIAEEIIARAKEHGVHVHQSKELVSLLMKVDLDRDIPPALYRAVAELLAWLYHIDTEKSETISENSGQKQI